MIETIASLNPSLSLLQCNSRHQLLYNFSNFQSFDKWNSTNCDKTKRSTTLYCSNSNNIYTVISTPSETENEDADDDKDARTSSPAGMIGNVPPMRGRRTRYRKQYPGEKDGITEEMRFVAMKLRNSGKSRKSRNRNINSGSKKEFESESLGSDGDENGGSVSEEEEEKDNRGNEGTWQPSIEGFIKYLVDSKLVFSTIERIVDESNDVSYAYFRKTGLERSECLSKDLLWFSERGNVIPEPSNPGVTYAQHLEELAEKTPPLFLCHFYNIYFSHIAGGQVIAKKVSEKLFEGRKLEFYAWEGEEVELLQRVRENINMLGKHWSRDEKNKCLREATKAFRFLGQIVRLIIL